MKRILVIIYFLSFIQMYSQRISEIPWEWLNPYPQGKAIFSVSFTDEETGWVGGYRTLLKTTDGGKNWDDLNFQWYSKIKNLHFINDSVGILTTTWDSELVLRTTDGGKNWNRPKSPIGSYLYNDLCFVNDSTGYIAGEYSYGKGIIFKTTDMGATWDSLHLPYESSALRTIHFNNELNGWAAGGLGFVWETTDGGDSWIWHYDIMRTGIYTFIDVEFIDDENGILLNENSGYALLTTDGGSNWNSVKISGYASQNSIEYVNKLVAFSCGTDGLYKTIDGGHTWFHEETSKINLNDSHFLQSGVGYIVGDRGEIYKTNDSGDNWLTLKKGPRTDFYAVKFVNSTLGYVGGNNGEIYITHTGGKEWSEITSSLDFSNRIIKLDVIGQNIYAASNSNLIFISSDQGDTWTKSELGKTDKIIYLQFFDDKSGYSGGRNGYFYTTVDGGLSWKSHSLPVDEDSVNAFSFVNRKFGFALVGNSKLFKTTNGGESWDYSILKNYEYLRFYDLDFLDPKTGYLSGEDGYLIKTTDGGNTFRTAHTSNESLSKKIKFANYYFGVSYNGAIVSYTIDGGSWWKNHSIRYWDINDFQGLDNKIYGVGGNGLVFRLEGPILSDISPQHVDKDGFFLNQNYPNPFNPTTIISFNIPQKNKTYSVSLIVYNLLGEELTKLIDYKLISGSYKVEFNAEDLPSGVYLYKLQVDNYTKTKKMILLK